MQRQEDRRRDANPSRRRSDAAMRRDRPLKTVRPHEKFGLTAGTIFNRTRTPITVWLAAVTLTKSLPSFAEKPVE